MLAVRHEALELCLNAEAPDRVRACVLSIRDIDLGDETVVAGICTAGLKRIGGSEYELVDGRRVGLKRAQC